MSPFVIARRIVREETPNSFAASETERRTGGVMLIVGLTYSGHFRLLTALLAQRTLQYVSLNAHCGTETDLKYVSPQTYICLL